MQDVLTAAGHSVDINKLEPPRRLMRAVRLVASGGPPYDLTIHTERAVRGWLELSRRNVLLPNPEWFDATPAVQKMDAILCKTRWTVEIMARFHPRPIFTGFTCVDRMLPDVERDELRPIHVAGRSVSKGTRAVLDVWRRNPALPQLTILAWGEGTVPSESIPANVTLMQDFVDDEEFRKLQVTCGFHLCPSEAEGFGHTMAEGLSTGALVLTTDAPPMNELVTSERGILVPWADSAPMRSGRRFVVNTAQLERAIQVALAGPPGSTTGIRLAARKWFEDNDAGFRRRLIEVVDELL